MTLYRLLNLITLCSDDITHKTFAERRSSFSGQFTAKKSANIRAAGNDKRSSLIFLFFIGKQNGLMFCTGDVHLYTAGFFTAQPAGIRCVLYRYGNRKRKIFFDRNRITVSYRTAVLLCLSLNRINKSVHETGRAACGIHTACFR